MNIVPFKALIPKLELIASNDSFFGTVKKEYPSYYKNGFFQETDLHAIYIYEVKTDIQTHRGFIADNGLDDIDEGKILMHEKTLAAKEQKMMNILLQNEAMVKPILLAYNKVDPLEVLFDEYIKDHKPYMEVDFKEAHEQHTLWRITEQEIIRNIQQLCGKFIPQVYIADGHHRTSTVLSMSKNKKFEERVTSILSVYFSFDDLAIYDFNRVIDISEIIDPTKFVAKLSKYVDIKPIKNRLEPRKKFEMTMFLDHNWYRLRWRKKYRKKYGRNDLVFDTQLLNELVLNKILKIKDVRDNPRITYVGGKDGISPLVEEALKAPHRVAFNMYPIKKTDLILAADRGVKLPPKSTWFEPRIKNGLLVHRF